MLQELRVEDFALVDRLTIEFSDGLNVLTGETGAGKSILIDAVAAVLGGRVSAEVVREGREKALIEAVFSISPSSAAAGVLKELGLWDEEEEWLILSREISANGRSKGRVNGRLVNVSQLALIGAELVDIHGQHDSQSLLSPARHLDLLDALGGDGLQPLRAAVAELAEERERLIREIAQLQEGERERARREDLLTYQIDEIAAARLEPGEEERLQAERERLTHAERLISGASEAYAKLYEGGEARGSALGLAGSARSALEHLLPLDPQLQPVVDNLEQAVISLQEAAYELRRYTEGLEADPARLGEVEERLQRIAALKRKYGDSIEEILAFAEEARQSLDALTSAGEKLAELQGRLKEIENRLSVEAAELSRRRRRVAEQAAGKIGERLASLSMPDARFEVGFSRDSAVEGGIEVDGEPVKVTRRGIDRVEFLFSANRGEPPRPLARIASGGEMSRVMLAIKATMAEVDPCATLIFDEVDAGIGGRTAESVASCLAELARSRQVLVVTHLAQIASRGRRHLTVEKRSPGARTEVNVTPLEGEERVLEIARMLDGKATETSVQHARALLEMAHKGKAAS